MELTDEDRKVIVDEIGNLKQALPFVEKDKRLGFQQEANCYMYSPDKIASKLEELEGYL